MIDLYMLFKITNDQQEDQHSRGYRRGENNYENKIWRGKKHAWKFKTEIYNENYL